MGQVQRRVQAQVAEEALVRVSRPKHETGRLKVCSVTSEGCPVLWQPEDGAHEDASCPFLAAQRQRPARGAGGQPCASDSTGGAALTLGLDSPSVQSLGQ